MCWRTGRPFFVFEKSMLLNSAPFLDTLKIWPTRFFYYAAASGAHLRQNHSIEPVKVLYNIYIYYFFYFIFFFGDVRVRSCTFVYVLLFSHRISRMFSDICMICFFFFRPFHCCSLKLKYTWCCCLKIHQNQVSAVGTSRHTIACMICLKSTSRRYFPLFRFLAPLSSGQKRSWMKTLSSRGPIHLCSLVHSNVDGRND